VTGKLSFKMWELTMPEDITIPLDPHQRHLPNRDPVRRLSLAGIPPRPLLLRSKLTPQEVRPRAGLWRDRTRHLSCSQ